MPNHALVIGIDQYWSEGAHLRGAVRDALALREWLLDPAGGNVPPENLHLVLAPGPHSPALDEELTWLLGTKANIIIAVNNLMELSGGGGERLYVFFAGHGLTARVSNRDESALVATDFTSINTDHSVALRSLWEFFETTQFQDQFFFVDACRNVPPWFEGGAEFEIGRWTLPRTRDPGMPPVQQFILYATSPKLKAAEDRSEPGKEHGAFTAALLDGLRGAGRAKAWSWERQCYEVRWERLADYVKKRIELERRKVGDAAERELFQIPQDSGSRGVADRERDVVVASFAPDTFAKGRLEVLIDPDAAYPEADVRVLNAVGDVVAGQAGSTGDSVVFYLAPGTYAARAAAPRFGEGRASEPVELYEELLPEERPKISLQPREEPPPDAAATPPADAPVEAAAATAAPAPAATRGIGTVATGRIPLTAPDPLSIVEVKDETGRVIEVGRARPELELPPGFYTISHVGPEAAAERASVALAVGEVEKRVELTASEPAPVTLELLKRMGGSRGEANTIVLPGGEPVAWARTSTLVAMALGKALAGERGAAALNLKTVKPSPKTEGDGGIAVYVVSDVEKPDLDSLTVRVWAARQPVSTAPEKLRQVGKRLAELVLPREPGDYWLSLERPDPSLERPEEAPPIVFALKVLRDRQTTIVVQIMGAVRLFQYQPALAGGAGSTPETLRRVEYLQRLLLAGRLDGARELAVELASLDDPFIGCLCGYVLLRLGLKDELRDVAERVTAAAPQLSDGFILRAEHAAAADTPGAKQFFTEAVAAGVPVFAEGLTRLLEGLRAHDVHHPRSSVVRYVFQNHLRGSMWSVFSPRRFEPGTLVVTGADTGLEA